MTLHEPPPSGYPEGRAAAQIAELGRKIAQLESSAWQLNAVKSWGFIGGAGEIVAGSGDFTTEHPEAGNYNIVWAPARRNANYAVVATANFAAEFPGPAWQLTTHEAAKCRLVFSKGGVGTNSAFSFVVFG